MLGNQWRNTWKPKHIVGIALKTAVQEPELQENKREI